MGKKVILSVVLDDTAREMLDRISYRYDMSRSHVIRKAVLHSLQLPPETWITAVREEKNGNTEMPV